MAKRPPSRAQVILEEQQDRVDKAKHAVQIAEDEVTEAEGRRDTAQAILSVHINTFVALQKLLARKPAAKPTKSKTPKQQPPPPADAMANGGDSEAAPTT